MPQQKIWKLRVESSEVDPSWSFGGELKKDNFFSKAHQKDKKGSTKSNIVSTLTVIRCITIQEIRCR